MPTIVSTCLQDKNQKRFSINWFWIIIGVLCITFSRGEEPVLPRFITKSWQSEDGLPGNVIRQVIQDRTGYLWIGTAEGLTRFDGSNFYCPNGPNDELWHKSVRTLYCCGDDLWITHPLGGLTRYRQGTMKEIIKPSREWRGNEIIAVVADQDGSVLIHRSSKSWRYSDGKGLQLIDRVREEEMQPAPVANEFTDRQGRLWYQDHALHIMVKLPTPGTPHLQITNGANTYKITSFYQDAADNIWATTQANGLIMIYEARVNILGPPFALPGASCFAITQDSNNMWWIATREGYIATIDPQEQVNTISLSTSLNRAVSCFYETANHQFFVGTKDGLCFKKKGQGFEPISQEVDHSKINAMCETDNGMIYLGGAYGMSIIHPEENLEKLPDQEFLGGSAITCMVTQKPDVIYAGTNDGRILRYQQKHFEDISPPESQGRRHISHLLMLDDGTLIASSIGRGIHVRRGKSWHHFDDSHGLPDARITSMILDHHQHLWLASLGGIFRIPLSEIIHSKAEIRVKWINRSDGMNTRECNGLTHPGIHRDANGQLYFPTTHGIVQINPSDFKRSGTKPKVIIESCTHNDQPLSLKQGSYHIGPGPQSIRWNFTSPEFRAPEKTRFLTRLTPLQKEWQSDRSERQLSFESLPHGTYQLEVFAIDGDGQHSEIVRSPLLTIAPQWWQKQAFQIFAMIASLSLAAMIAAALMRLRLKRRIQELKIRNARENERTRIARDLHDDLGASLTEISLIANMHSGAEPNTPLKRIAEKSHTLVTTLDEIVWAINPKHDSSVSIVEYLSAYAHEFLTQADIALRLKFPPTLDHHPMDAERRHALFLCIREALNNIIKHSQATEVSLSFGIEPTNLQIALHDNGQGFDATHKHLGDGLHNLTQRLRPYAGNVVIHSQQRNGTTITFTLPWN